MENTERGMKQNLDISKFFKLGNLSIAQVEQKYCNMTLLRMLGEESHADVTIHANGGSVKAHKSVLVNVSPVFKAMFMHAMQEQLTSTVNLPDISIQGLELFLVLVYVLNDNVVAPLELQSLKHFDELVEACCKYQVNRLWPTLTAYWKSHLTPENCWVYINNRSVPSEIHLESWTYILEHHKEVIASERFISEMQTHPQTIHSFVKTLSIKLSAGSTYYHLR